MVIRSPIQMNLVKWFFIVLMSLFLVYLGYRWVDRQFRVENVMVTIPNQNNTFSSSDRLNRIKKLFSEPYTYLDRGKQTFVFASPNEHYVLKFFDARCLLSGPYPLLAPIGKVGCEKRLKQVLSGYSTAFRHIPDDTALIYFQSYPVPSYSLPITVVDRFGITHAIDLAEVPFALQKKGVPSRVLISFLLSHGDVQGAVFHISQLIDLYMRGYRKGIVDDDRNVMYNTGFIDGIAVRLDLGRLREDDSVKDPHVYRQDLHQIFVIRFGNWMSRHFPQYQDQIAEAIKIQLANH